MERPPTSQISQDIEASKFVCDCDGRARSACAGESFYKEHEGKRYCVLHFPMKEKSADFEKAFQRKLDKKDFNFCGIWFPDELHLANFVFSSEVNFSSATFRKEADFLGATFKDETDFTNANFDAAVHFSQAVFSARVSFASAGFSAYAGFNNASFSAKAVFRIATFSQKADFNEVTFGVEADFSLATFSSYASFTLATFNADTDFSGTVFGAEANFRSSTFKGYIKFAGDQGRPVFSDLSSLDMQFARIEQPDHVLFHTVTLQPHWFVNVNARKFDFTNVDWTWRSTNEEMKALESKKVEAPDWMMAIACRHLAVNAEEGHSFEDASRFRYMAMDARRRAYWRGLGFWRLGWWYWLASGYGENVPRAFMVLIGILLISAGIYTRVGFSQWETKVTSRVDVATATRDEVGAPLGLKRALAYSAGVMMLQRPEPRPATPAAQLVVFLETILGPVQAALLVLAIRRRFHGLGGTRKKGKWSNRDI